MGDYVKRAFGRGAVAAAAVWLAGCAQMAPTRSGYLSDYSRLQPTDAWVTKYGGDHTVLAGQTAGPLVGVDSFYLEPVDWRVAPDARASEDPDYRAALPPALGSALRDELGAVRPFVDAPGPRTARVRASVTDVALSRPVVNVALTALVGPLANGGAVAEAEVVGPDGRQLAAVVSASTGGPLEFTGFYRKGRHAEAALQRAAADLREAVGGDPPPATAGGPRP